LILKIGNDEPPEMLSLLARWRGPAADYFECTAREARQAFLHRFVIAGAAIRFQAIHPHHVEGIIALDVALRRNDAQWIKPPPLEVERHVLHSVYYGHFLCHVLHQDFIVAKGADCAAIKDQLLRELDARGARYPAEHNVGHQYRAPAELAAFYRSLDPGNRFNPGIGGAPKTRGYLNGLRTISNT
jgi:D-lactate dehydrogenase